MVIQNVIEAIETAKRLAGMTTKQLSGYSVAELRKLARCIGADYAGLRKAALVESVEKTSVRLLAELSGAVGIPVVDIPKAETSVELRIDQLISQLKSIDDSDLGYAAATLSGSWLGSLADVEQSTQRRYSSELYKRLTAFAEAIGDERTSFLVAKVISSVKGSLRGFAASQQATYQASVAQRQRSQKKPASDLMIWAVGKVAEAANGGINKHTDYRDVVLALILTTGRRPSEVLCRLSEFVAIGAHRISFTGAAKTKGANDGLDRVIEFDTPAKASDVVAAIAALKDAGYRLKSHGEVNSKYGVQLMRQVLKVTGETPVTREEIKAANDAGRTVEANTKVYDLRHMWASYQVARYYQPNEGSVNIFMARVLGHGANDIGTQNSYQSYNIEWSKEALSI